MGKKNTPELDAREFERQRRKPNVLPWVVCFLLASTLGVLPALWRVECSMHPSLIEKCSCSEVKLEILLGAWCDVT